MAKRTAIIDIGSNSVRMAVFEKTSRYAFHLIKEIKSKVRLGEGTYNNNAYLQEEPTKRTYDTLKEFADITKTLKCHKTICVATSALRDAPNSHELIKPVAKNLSLNIRIISGEKEAFYGALSASNLLPYVDEALSIDIGGGSTELAKIKNGKVVKCISLKLGTVRLKELFFNPKKDYSQLEQYLNEAICKIPEDFKSKNVFAIGGTLRALSEAIMEKTDYPLKTVHGFSYEFREHEDFINSVMRSSIMSLKDTPFKQDRYDTIREGCSIFYFLAKYLNISKVTTSGVGVREGVYLENLLRSSRNIFPENFNPSIRSLQDRFCMDNKNNAYMASLSENIFYTLMPLHNIEKSYLKELKTAGKLYDTGLALSFYQHHLHGFYFILNNLNFGFTHEQKILIALLIKYHSKRLPDNSDLKEFAKILPEANILNWLSFMLSLAKALNTDLQRKKWLFEFHEQTLIIKSKSSFKLAQEATRKLAKPAPFAIIFQNINS